LRCSFFDPPAGGENQALLTAKQQALLILSGSENQALLILSGSENQALLTAKQQALLILSGSENQALLIFPIWRRQISSNYLFELQIIVI